MFIMGDEVLEPRNCTSDDIVNGYGESHIFRRQPKDEHYEDELLLKTIMLLDTNTRHRAYLTEYHALRVQNGEWSYWDADDKGRVRRKITDLEYDDSSTVHPKFVPADQPWMERYGRNRYLGLEFSFHGNEPHLTITHKIQWENGRETVEVTTYSKVAEYEQEGWSKWLMDKMKAGYQKFRAYGNEA